MYKRTITYTDFNGVERSEDFYFNLNQSELIEMDAQYPEGFTEHIDKVMKNNDRKELINIFNDLILRSYGIKSEDGRRFVKTNEISANFKQTPAFDTIFMELAFDSDKASEFVNGLIPANLQNALATQLAA